MEEKEQAKELIRQIQLNLFKERGVSISQEDISYISSIVIDILINDSKTIYTQGETDIDEYRKYWSEVKKELEKQ